MKKKTALDTALHFLKFRPRSCFEVEKKLKQKKYTNQEIKKTIEALKKESILNDLEFAKMWIRNRNQLSPRGSRLLFLELRKLGIDTETAQNALKIEDLSEIEKARIVFNKKKKSLEKLSPDEFRKKMIGFLSRKGFDWRVISQVLTAGK